MNKIFEKIFNLIKRRKTVCIVVVMMVLGIVYLLNSNIETPSMHNQRIADENEDGDGVLISVIEDTSNITTDITTENPSELTTETSEDSSVKPDKSSSTNEAVDSDITNPDTGNPNVETTQTGEGISVKPSQAPSGLKTDNPSATGVTKSEAPSTDKANEGGVSNTDNHQNTVSNNESDSQGNTATTWAPQPTRTPKSSRTTQPTSSAPTSSASTSGASTSSAPTNSTPTSSASTSSAPTNRTPTRNAPTASPTSAGDNDKEITVRFSITCTRVLNNDDLDTTATIPEDGIIFSGSLVVKNNSSVYDVLKAVCSYAGISYVNAGTNNYVYISSIANLSEKQCGRYSGWKYRVNDVVPNRACGNCYLNDGDEVEWYYATHYND